MEYEPRRLSITEKRKVQMMRLPFSQEQVAVLLNVSPGFFSNWLNGKRRSSGMDQRFQQFYAQYMANKRRRESRRQAA